MNRSFIAIVLAVFFTLTLSGCSDNKTAPLKNKSSDVQKSLPNQEDSIITWATNPQYPPYDWAENESDSSYQGAGVELLTQIIPKGYKLKAVMVSWKRAQEMAKEGKLDLLVNLRKTPERSSWLEFSSSPTFYNPIVIFMKKEKAIPLKSWNELIPLMGGTSLGDTYGNGFDEFLSKKLKTESSPSMVNNFNKLATGRIDYFVSGYYMGMAWLSANGMTRDIVALTPPISNNSIYLGFSKKSKFTSLLPEMNTKLTKLNQNGTLHRLLDKYLKKFTTMSLKVFPK